MQKVWLALPGGEPVEVEATPENLTIYMVEGYMQCEPPVHAGMEVNLER